MVLANGSPIIVSQIYTGATIKFLIDGGDDFKGQSGLFTNIVNTNINIKQKIQDVLYESEELTEDSLKNPSSL